MLSSNFVITRMIIDQIGLHSVLLPFLINIIAVITIIIFFKLGDISYDEKVKNVYFSFVSYLSVYFSFSFLFLMITLCQGIEWYVARTIQITALGSVLAPIRSEHWGMLASMRVISPTSIITRRMVIAIYCDGMNPTLTHAKSDI